jgi:hypothetical protein
LGKLKGRLLAIATNIRLGNRRLPGTNALTGNKSLIKLTSRLFFWKITAEKEFNSTGPKTTFITTPTELLLSSDFCKSFNLFI